MNLLGIIADYNPFHNGHKFHIQKSLESLSPNAIVVVMSGNFTQRGNIACYDKWTRTKCALLNGADLVVELPVTFATGSAERFAHGGVYLLDKIGTKYISFGAEDKLSELNAIASQLLNESFLDRLSGEMPYHLARQELFEENKIISKPNNILAIEYLKAICLLNSSMIPFAIERIGTSYHDKKIVENFTSATHLRGLISENADFGNVVPENIKDIYENSFFASDKDVFKMLRYSIISKNGSELEKYAHIREGIENRILKQVFNAENYDELIKSVKSKRYTYTSISRMLISILLGIKKDELPANPSYIRVLGLNDNGAKALKFISKNCNLPIITKVADAKHKLSEFELKEFELDLKATDIYYNAINKNMQGRADYLMSPIKI